MTGEARDAAGESFDYVVAGGGSAGSAIRRNQIRLQTLSRCSRATK
jgi:hypothetical protein